MIDDEIDFLIHKIKQLPNETVEASKDDLKKGVLNYVVTRIADGLIGDDLKYGKVNDVIGALECCKMELYRRLAAPYEDKKIEGNGDVYKER